MGLGTPCLAVVLAETNIPFEMCSFVGRPVGWRRDPGCLPIGRPRCQGTRRAHELATSICDKSDWHLPDGLWSQLPCFPRASGDPKVYGGLALVYVRIDLAGDKGVSWRSDASRARWVELRGGLGGCCGCTGRPGPGDGLMSSGGFPVGDCSPVRPSARSPGGVAVIRMSGREIVWIRGAGIGESGSGQMSWRILIELEIQHCGVGGCSVAIAGLGVLVLMSFSFVASCL